MNIAVIGTGYVGLVSGTCFAQMGNKIICVDIDENKINKLKQSIIPIYEPGLSELVKENYTKKTLSFTTDTKKAVQESEIIFIAVGTPQGEDGSADLQYVLAVAKDIGKYINGKKIIVDKSTVPVGTADKVSEVIKNELKNRGVDFEFEVVSNPEFLKEGDAINDFMKPDRIVVGAKSNWAMEKMKELYRPFSLNHEKFIAMDVKSAELTKYAANAMLATKISFINEISQIADSVGADINKVRIGIGSDKRIGYSFIYPGIGYGGSCFPKDVQALIKIAKDAGVEPKIINAVEAVNKAQREYFINKILKHFGSVKGLTFSVWGLSFKPETDDMREAPSITIIKTLINLGAKIKAYDPKAINEAKEFYLKDIDVEYCDNKYDTLNGADSMILVTEWKEFRSPDFYEIKQRLKNPIIFDARNQYNKDLLNELGFTYYQIGVR
jgi:UDPglucose 6-dehydrogenase